MNVISFSLWGNDLKYYKGALENINLAKFYYPGWVCRFYVDRSVDSGFISLLNERGAHVVQVQDVLGPFHGMYWRYMVNDDPTVEKYVIRDADSRISFKEHLAVDAWLRSGKAFHNMRDCPGHFRKMQGAMWGGTTGKFSIQQLINENAKYAKWGDDEFFLSNHVWPLIKDDCLIHDPYYDKKPFPTYNNGITFYTVCRNRLEHLKCTFPQNINNINETDNYIIMDYGDEQSLGKWIKKEYKSMLDSGKIIYYRFDTDKFNASHSRNMCIRLANKNIVCNVDADNWFNKGFSEYIKDNLEFDSFFRVIAPGGVRLENGYFGRCAVHRQNIIAVNGYTENVYYGPDDIDLFERLKLCGLRPKPIPFHFMSVIPHDDSIRLQDIKDKVFAEINGKTYTDLSIFVNDMSDTRKRQGPKANINKNWGVGKLVKNFEEEVTLDTNPQAPNIIYHPYSKGFIGQRYDINNNPLP